MKKERESDFNFSHSQIEQNNDNSKDEYKPKSYSERVDPIVSLKNSNQINRKSNSFGYIASLELQSKKFCSYEVFMYVEDNLGIEIDELSIFRGKKEKPTGIVLLRFKQKISISKLSLLNKIPFKGKSVKTNLFYSQDEYQEYIQPLIDDKLKQIYLPFRINVPLICVAGFDIETEEDKMKELFSNCGMILLIEKYRDMFILYFSEEKSALFANRNFNLYPYKENEIRVTLFYPKNIQRAFGVRGCSDSKYIFKTILCFGKIEKYFIREDGSIFILMENIETAKAACLTLNSQKIGTNYIQTFFITYPEFQILSNST